MIPTKAWACTERSRQGFGTEEPGGVRITKIGVGVCLQEVIMGRRSNLYTGRDGETKETYRKQRKREARSWPRRKGLSGAWGGIAR